MYIHHLGLNMDNFVNSTWLMENEALKEQLSEVQTLVTARALKAEKQVDEFTRLLDDTKAAAESAKQRSEEAIQMTIERKDLERDKALVELERKHQD